MAARVTGSNHPAGRVFRDRGARRLAQALDFRSSLSFERIRNPRLSAWNVYCFRLDRTERQGVRRSTPVTVQLAGSDIEGLVLHVSKGPSLTGRVLVDGEAPAEWKNALPDGFYIKSVRAGNTDVTDTGVDLTTGVSAQVEVVVSPKGGLVRGVVQDPSTDRPSPGAIVILMPKEQERRAFSYYCREAKTDPRGAFTFRNVVPGDYNIYAWDDIEFGTWSDRDFMKPFEDQGQSVTVGESAQISVQVKVLNSQ
jgi:hypothetical protein